MKRYTDERAEHDLKELGVILRAWHGNRDSDSVTFQELRQTEFAAGEAMMKELVYGLQPEKRLQLTIGRTAVRAFRLNRHATSTRGARVTELAPDTTLDLRRADGYTDWDRPLTRGLQFALFAGDKNMVRLDTIAETLADGGSLDIVEADTGEAAAA
jgi:hypothetical protein